MQIAAMHPDSPGYESEVRAFVQDAFKPRREQLVRRFISLLSAGIARSPSYERNQMLADLFPQDRPEFANAQIGEAVVKWLCTGCALPVAVSGLSRDRLVQKPGAHWVYETYTQSTLRRDAWRRYPELQPILVEGSPDAPYAKTIRNLSPVRRTHLFVMLRMGGRMYVIDGARGMLFDSLGAYLEAVMLPGYFGESSVRMKWFRIFDGGRENDEGGVRRGGQFLTALHTRHEIGVREIVA